MTRSPGDKKFRRINVRCMARARLVKEGRPRIDQTARCRRACPRFGAGLEIKTGRAWRGAVALEPPGSQLERRFELLEPSFVNRVRRISVIIVVIGLSFV